MIHQGEAAVQRRTGVDRGPWGSAGTRPEIPPVAADFLWEQRLLVLGAADADGSVWADAVTGPPGFAEAFGERTVVVAATPALPEFPGEGDIGILALEPQTRRRIRVNGTMRRDGERLVVHTEQVYGNCPKHIQTREVAEEPVTAPVPGTPRSAASLSDAQREWISGADTFFVATRAPGHGADVSHRGGNPGFVHVTGPTRLSWPDYSGNGMYMTLGNLELDPSAGLLFLDWEQGHTLHLTGQARVDWDPERAAATPGAQRWIDFDVRGVVEIPRALGLRWEFGELHRFNPPVGPPRVAP
ncbi:pyridoxamine 5'-phosphate oxidase family protein [Actinomadura roseirufa]|uniref:pyridoxamine 5'-phosphate oxidase family protein n=1 Tax=Actinomadura roseirufa TaxID=2094049 RepID=UPI0010417FF8|nr:pyridoxamine 5'-phosphate oxidase family protein [Actinomadura roseirufa]